MKNLVDELRAGAEIVRLLGIVKEDRPALCRAIADEFAAAKAEIERLHRDIEALTKNQLVHMAIIEKLETQIKELRGLLQEALNGPGWQDEYWRSAAEGALGEENELTDQVEQLRQCQQADGWTINQQSKEIERLRERITNALDALNDADISGATLILYEGVREALNE